jgi:putative molybdopterin biosynthesis protein
MTDPLHQQQFLNVVERDEAERRFRAVLDLSPLDAEDVPLADSWGRVLAADVIAPVDVPGFDRSNVDGFAVRAGDTFGAGEDSPRLLRLLAEVGAMGYAPSAVVAQGTTMAIATGGMLPRGVDAVVMIEHTAVVEGLLRLTRPVAPGANVTFAGTDIGRGEVVLRRGELLGARDTGVLAAIGVARIPVVRRPRVAIISTGDELVTPGEPIAPGQAYDSNATVLADAVRELGGEPRMLGIVPDDFAALSLAVRSAIEECDVVLLSGGTSKGAGDISYRVLGEFGPPGIVAHGVALKPGKPLCLAAVTRPNRRPIPVAVLPGFPTSAVFTFREFLAPVIRALAGRRDDELPVIEAQLPTRVNSERGRTEFLLVSLVERFTAEGAEKTNHGFSAPSAPSAVNLFAYPMGQGSGSVTAFARADGFIVIPRQREYLEASDVVEVQLLDATVRPADLVVIGSHCVGLDYLLGRLHAEGWSSKFLAVGSSGGLDAAKRGECDLAGIHLLDPTTDEYNRPFLTAELDLIRGYRRLQGLVFRPGDPRFECKSLHEAITAALADSDCVMVNRNRGSGTRILIDRLLGKARPQGYLTEARSHNAVVAAVVQGRADWGLAIAPAAKAAGLGFIGCRDERYDFVVPRVRLQRPAVQAFVRLLQRPETRAALAALGFPSD